ncbi:MAG: ytpA 2 [Candidatus Angelobacter sp.]|nr:ytpA 2 [Candidatus Angelobacter sp.]
MNHGTMNICADSIRTLACEDGHPVRYRIWPTSEDPVAALFLVSGMMSHSGWFCTLASALSESRIKVIGADRRGSGLNEQDRGDASSRHTLISDLLKIIEQENSGLPIYMVGWCWGAVLVINAALEFGSKVSGVALLAPGLFPSERISLAMRRVFTLPQSTPSASGLVKSPLTEEMFSDILEFQEFIANDDLALRTFTAQFVRVCQQMQLVAAARLTQLRNPVLLLLAAKDQTVDNAKTLMAFQTLPAGAVTCAILPCNHGMQFEAPQEIAGHIAKWVNRPAAEGKGMR